MLVLTRKLGEKLLIGEDIVITVLDVRSDSVRLGIDAPRGITIARAEVVEAVSQANIAAVESEPGAEEHIKNLLGHALPATRAHPAAAEPRGS